MITIDPTPLTRDLFAPYGDVIEADNHCQKRIINDGNTTRFHDLAQLDLTRNSGSPLVNIFRSTPLPRPIIIEKMERHPLSSQAFFPLGGSPYLVVVAGSGDFSMENLRAFVAAPHQGVNYAAGVWHHYSLALDTVSDFLVIDRAGPETNCDEVFFSETPVTINY